MTYDFRHINREIAELTKTEASVERLRSVNLSSHTYEDAFVLPSKDLWVDGKCHGGVVTRENQFVESSAWHEGKRCDKYDFSHEEATPVSSTVIYLGFFNSVWGHALTDNIKKLWFLFTEEYKQLSEQGAKIIYITAGNQTLPKYAVRLLELCGVDTTQLHHVTEVTRFSKIVVPDNSFIADNGERFYTKEYRQTIDRIKSNASRCALAKVDKIYFTRTNLKGIRDFGEKQIENTFRKMGYTIVSPEQYSVDEQIFMLSHCTHFAATEGSVSHGAVFCASGTNVAIVRKVNDVNKYQMAINAVADLNVTYIDAHHSTQASPQSPWVGPFYLCINNNLERYVGHKLFHLPLCLMPSWWHYNLLNKYIYKKLMHVKNRFNK